MVDLPIVPTSHTYNENVLNETMVFLTTVFYPLVRDLYFNLKKALLCCFNSSDSTLPYATTSKKKGK
jgi:hypothetical protein